uniref:Uncharacterized protein n=1 Tax=Oryza brachyantha TaxID=4533 RepID=J3LUV8_ORYBR
MRMIKQIMGIPAKAFQAFLVSSRKTALHESHWKQSVSSSLLHLLQSSLVTMAAGATLGLGVAVCAVPFIYVDAHDRGGMQHPTCGIQFTRGEVPIPRVVHATPEPPTVVIEFVGADRQRAEVDASDGNIAEDDEADDGEDRNGRADGVAAVGGGRVPSPCFRQQKPKMLMARRKRPIAMVGPEKTPRLQTSGVFLVPTSSSASGTPSTVVMVAITFVARSCDD